MGDALEDELSGEYSFKDTTDLIPALQEKKPAITKMLRVVDEEFQRIIGSYPAQSLDYLFAHVPEADLASLVAMDQPFLHRLNRVLPGRQTAVRKRIRSVIIKAENFSGTQVYGARVRLVKCSQELEGAGKIEGYRGPADEKWYRAKPRENDDAFLQNAQDREAVDRLFESQRKEFPAWMKYFEALWSQPGVLGSMPYE